MSKMRAVISENTGISVGLLISIIGLVVWLTDLHATASTTASAVIQVQEKQESSEAAIHEIRERLISIESKLDQSLRRK